jgi:hypothetical protein
MWYVSCCCRRADALRHCQSFEVVRPWLCTLDPSARVLCVLHKHDQIGHRGNRLSTHVLHHLGSGVERKVKNLDLDVSIAYRPSSVSKPFIPADHL